MAEVDRYIEGTIMRTARKPHTCRECRRTIQKGERYAEYIGEVASWQSGSRYHLGACADKQLVSTDYLNRHATKAISSLLRF